MKTDIFPHLLLSSALLLLACGTTVEAEVEEEKSSWSRGTEELLPPLLKLLPLLPACSGMRSSLGELTALLSTCCLLDPCLLPACLPPWIPPWIPPWLGKALCLEDSSWLACLPDSSNLFVGWPFCLPDAWLPDICLPDIWFPDIWLPGTCLPDIWLPGTCLPDMWLDLVVPCRLPFSLSRSEPPRYLKIDLSNGYFIIWEQQSMAMKIMLERAYFRIWRGLERLLWVRLASINLMNLTQSYKMSCWQDLWCWRQWWRQSRWKSCWHDDNNKIRCERKKVFTTIAVWKTHVGAQKVPHEKYLEYFKPYQQMIYLGTESISSRTESILSLLSSTLTCKV